jgi:hypothetical protein
MEDTKSALTHAQAALAQATQDRERGEIHNLMGAIHYTEYFSDTTLTDKLQASPMEFRNAIRLNPRLGGSLFQSRQGPP